MHARSLTERVFLAIRRHSPAAESLIHTLCHLASEREAPLFVVGGLLRDALIGANAPPRASLDIDLAVEGSPEPFLPVLAEVAPEGPITYSQFGTASATLPDGTGVDLAQTRTEHYASPATLPRVKPARIDEDLRRRDFSINAMALVLIGEHAGTLLDPYGGVRDLKRKQITTLHPDSFRDDPTRLIRAARYAARLGASIERRTAREARLNRHHLQALTPERFGDAWRLLLEEPEAASALGFARRWKIPQSRNQRWTVPAGALRACQSVETFWASLGLLDADAAIIDWLPGSVGMRRTERRALAAGVSLRQLRRSLGRTRRPSRIAAQLTAIPDSALEVASRLWAGPSGAAVSAYLQRRPEVGSPISASELIRMGLQPGPQMGKTLKELEALVWDGELDPHNRSAVTRLKQRIRLSR